MSINKHIIILAAATVWFVAPTQADSGSASGNKTYADEGFYVSPQVGGSVVQDLAIEPISASAPGISGTLDATIEFDAGFRFDAPVGYRFNEWFSLEFAPGVIYNPMNSISLNGEITIGGQKLNAGDTLDLDGNLIQVPLLVNFIFTIPTDSKWEPFIGGGVGALYSSATFTNVSSGAGTLSLDQDADCWALGYSALAGLNYHFSRDISIGFIYKFTGTGSQSYGGSDFADLLQTNGTFTHSVQADATFRF